MKTKNIGPVSRHWLMEIELHSLQDLRRHTGLSTDSENHPDVSLNLIWVLEGAILDIDWRDLTEARKQALRLQLSLILP
jgi:hypothetical protein